MRYINYNRSNILKAKQVQKLSRESIETIQALSYIFPFKVNNYVLNLINWDNYIDDPIFRMTFPHQDMLSQGAFSRLMDLYKAGDAIELKKFALSLQKELNPNPASQIQLNRPDFRGHILSGLQHKYKNTVLYFPKEGQTCHAYCTYCFRWPQFFSKHEKFRNTDLQELIDYVSGNDQISDVIITGGDALFMSFKQLERILNSLVKIEHLKNIRLGTKVCAYWPYRFITDIDSTSLLNLMEKISKSGKHLAFMSHYSHAAELKTKEAMDAIRLIRNSGVTIRSQAPIIKHVNDTAQDWVDMWNEQLKLGIIPYYCFIERNTGPYDYFKIPLIECLDIYQTALKSMSGLAKTVRGPIMSCSPGKIQIIGVLGNGKYRFILKFIQARNSSLVDKCFLASGTESSTWISDLKAEQCTDVVIENQW